MSDAQTERPRFYQGQFLGPEDLAAAVDHARWSRARHDLGAHAWGIAVGLALREVETLEGGLEVYVEPGYAVDGFGRPLVVTTPLPVPIDALGRLRVHLAPGQTSAAVPVWLRYTETATAEPPFGFESCEGADPFARVAEGVEVLVGDRTLADRRDPVEVDGESVDPAEVLRTIETTAPLLCDASVPFQTFPAGDDRWWLIPLGHVRWQPGFPSGQILETTEEDRRASRHLRRHLGVVTEGVYAAGDLIRLRPRATVPGAGALSTEQACDDPLPRTQGDVDLAYDAATGRVTPRELVWVEGHLRIAGDARLFGGEIEFRLADGDTGGVPMRIRRTEANAFLDPAGNPAPGSDLEVRIGSTGDDGRHRLVIGVNPDEGTVGGRVVVQNDGRVGIGTLDPPSPLLSPLTIRAIGAGEELLSFESTRAGATARRWHVSAMPAGANGLAIAETGVNGGRLFLAAGGNVGMSTTAPAAKLDIAGLPVDPGALWFRVGDGGDSGRVWVEYSADLAPRLVLSDGDDPPRIRFQQVGNGADERASPQFASWIGHARGGAADLAVMGGRLGIGTTDPQAPLHVAGGTDVALATGASGFLMVGTPGSTNLVMDTNELMARNNGVASTLHFQAEGGDLIVHGLAAASRRVAVLDSGSVGLGTEAPLERLDVRGNVKLGAAGEFFAVGGVENLRALTGQVGSGGARVRGAGFTSARSSAGRYLVTFDTAFPAPPVVVASLVDSPGEDHVVTVRSVVAGSFQITANDVLDDGQFGPTDTAFTFVALGPRA